MVRTLLAACLFLVSGRVAGLDTDITFFHGPRGDTVTVGLIGLDRKEIQDHILKGFQSRIQYRVRMYRKTPGLTQLLGDKILFETQPARTGRWDVISRNFEIEFDNGGKKYFSVWQEFADNFFNLIDFPVPSFTGSSVYVLAQVYFQKAVLHPPLNLLSLFFDRHTLTSPWRRLEID
jgi:hypothetical protein